MDATDAVWNGLLSRCAKEGAEAGKNAASWFFDGNTSDETYAAVAKGIKDGDPAVLDTFPFLDLSGQWADGDTDTDVLDAINCEQTDDEEQDDDAPYDSDATYSVTAEEADELIDAFRAAFDDAVHDEIKRMVLAHNA